MRTAPDRVVAAIDVGTNATRLVIARVRADGALEPLRRERDGVRPGEGVFATGAMPAAVVDRLVATLRRYAGLCRALGANAGGVRAVATSALRDARNRDAIVARVRAETGLALEIVSGAEEARLVSAGVLAGRPPDAPALVVDIGGGSTEVVVATGDRPTRLASAPLGAVRLTELFETSDRVAPGRLAELRAFADAAFEGAIPPDFPTAAEALGSSGTIWAIVAREGEGGRLALPRLARAVDALASTGFADRCARYDPRRAEIVVAGAVVLEAAMRRLAVAEIVAVEGGLREGVLAELARRSVAPAAR